METIQGVRTKLVLISGTHGAVRIPLAQSFNYTPKLTETTINEFDNLEAALVVTSFDGVDVSFDYLDTDGKLVDACFADIDPASAVVYDDPSNYKKVTLFANMKSLADGKIFASVICKGLTCKGAPYTEAVKDYAKVTRDLSGTNVIKYKGAAILYSRFVVPTFTGYEQAIPPNAYEDVAFTGTSGASGYSGCSGAFSKVALPVDGASGYDILVMKNGEAVETGYTINANGFEVPYSANTDVWEVFSLYADV